MTGKIDITVGKTVILAKNSHPELVSGSAKTMQADAENVADAETSSA